MIAITKCKHGRNFCLECHAPGDSTDKLDKVRDALRFENQRIEPVRKAVRVQCPACRGYRLEKRWSDVCGGDGLVMEYQEC